MSKDINEGAVKNKMIEIAEFIASVIEQTYNRFSDDFVRAEEINDHVKREFGPDLFNFFIENRDYVMELVDTLTDMNLFESDKNYLVPRLSENYKFAKTDGIEWPKEVRDEADDVPYPGGMTQDDIDEQYLIPRVNEAYGIKMWSIPRVEKEKLEPIAEKLGKTLFKGKRENKPTYGKKVISQFYNIGDVPIMVRTVKVAGMGADHAEVWVLDKNNPSKGIRFNGMMRYDGLEEYIEKELGGGNKPPELTYSEEKLNMLLRDLKNTGMDSSDDEAFDLARGILSDEEGLEEYLKTQKGIRDPLGWLANKIE